MLDIKENVALSEMTTLGIGGAALYFVQVEDHSELQEALDFAREKNVPFFMLAGGSNVLVSDSGFDGLVIRPHFLGKEIIEETDEFMRIKVGAGESLDDTVAWTVENDWWGMENLSFVPGSMGSLVIQNVNAYGAKAEHVVESIEAVDTQIGDTKKIDIKGCVFTYRHSIFNTTEKGRYIITSVTLKLSKTPAPNLTYKDLENYFKQIRNRVSKSVSDEPSQKEIREAVIKIRSDKGQDWTKVKSAGSFFSNFLLDDSEYKSLQEKVEENFGTEKVEELLEVGDRFRDSTEGGKTKIPAAWILDKILNLKGTTVGGAMLSEVQVLNVINTGDATSKDVMELFRKVRQQVYEKTGLELVNEPELVGFSDDELKHYFDL